MGNVKLALLIILTLTNVSFAFDNDQATEMLYLSKFTDKRIPVVVLDTGINFKDNKVTPYLCVNGHRDYTGEGLFDYNGHGTNVAWQIIKSFNKKKYCILSVKYYLSTSLFFSSNLRKELQGIEYAIELKAALINFSGGGESYSLSEDQVVKKALSSNIKVVVAAGNNGSNLDEKCNFFPACLKPNKNLYVVGSLSAEGKKMGHSNYGHAVTNWALGERVEDQNGKPLTGTSQATAVLSGKLLKNMENR
jgi:major intracellular serine protease